MMRLMLGFHDRDWWIVVPKEMEGGDPLHNLAINGDGKVLACLFPVVNYEFFGFSCIED